MTKRSGIVGASLCGHSASAPLHASPADAHLQCTGLTFDGPCACASAAHVPTDEVRAAQARYCQTSVTDRGLTDQQHANWRTNMNAKQITDERERAEATTLDELRKQLTRLGVKGMSKRSKAECVDAYVAACEAKAPAPKAKAKRASVTNGANVRALGFPIEWTDETTDFRGVSKKGDWGNARYRIKNYLDEATTMDAAAIKAALTDALVAILDRGTVKVGPVTITAAA